ncbi:MAG: hypothetical protein EBS61_10750 [Betaproteobacteria bacterium]|nr:hypothetical protein [Betaproteobacteria bacterium]
MLPGAIDVDRYQPDALRESVRKLHSDRWPQYIAIAPIDGYRRHLPATVHGQNFFAGGAMN